MQPKPDAEKQPAAVGYVSVPICTTGAQIRRVEKHLRSQALHRGHRLTRVFVERPGSATSAFAGLMDVLRTSRAATVVVPHVGHLARMPGVRSAMRLVIEDQMGARLVETETEVASC